MKMVSRIPGQRKRQAQCDEWNLAHPTGTLVRYIRESGTAYTSTPAFVTAFSAVALLFSRGPRAAGGSRFDRAGLQDRFRNLERRLQCWDCCLQTLSRKTSVERRYAFQISVEVSNFEAVECGESAGALLGKSRFHASRRRMGLRS